MNNMIYSIIYMLIATFAVIILLLQVHLISKRMIDSIDQKKRSNYQKSILTDLNILIDHLEKQFPSEEITQLYQNAILDKSKRAVLEEILIHQLESARSVQVGVPLLNTKSINLSKLCDDIGLIDLEITALINNKNPYKISRSCKILGEYRSKKALPAILNHVSNNNLDVKYNALLALAKIGDLNAYIDAFIILYFESEVLGDQIYLSQRSMIEIVDSFEGDKLEMYNTMIDSNTSYLSTVFIKSAGNYGDKAVSEKIIRYVKDSNRNRRAACTRALGQLKDNRYINDLIEALDDADWECRAVAAKSLGLIGDARALNALMKTLSDKEWWVRYNSACSIVQIPEGLNLVESIMSNDDLFAKDIIMSALENSKNNLVKLREVG